MPDTARRPLYPEITPYRSGRLRVSDLHELYFEECGNPQGIPALVLHGGPGGGISPFLRQGHDPARYRIILMDQRGAGQSTPHACLEENTTWDLVADIERLRSHLGIDRWQVVGGSWGSTLALAYAISHPARVTALVLRGIFTLRKAEIGWFYQSGASALFPDAWEQFVAPIPETERGDLLTAYHRRLSGPDGPEKTACARAWSRWEGTTISLLPNPARAEAFSDDHFATAFAGIECHYFAHGGFFESDGWLIANAHRLRGIPAVLIHGRYDVCTPLSIAWDLHRAWPEAELQIIPDAGHTGTEPGIADAMVRATDRFADQAATGG
ncbi:prolyl aminopeptidase [Tabrizicola fusiformis]|uniref:prolyl aminopeptidase n=1 Tax=Tabrizicola sp. SY72 TaxID=2741673 RepID=UPI00157480FE|nr:prolyl aminopeptidase [Tabrizicola sp. SY72]